MAELSINLRKELVLNAIRRIEDSKAAAIDAESKHLDSKVD